jgi:hypothetical protein
MRGRLLSWRNTQFNTFSLPHGSSSNSRTRVSKQCNPTSSLATYTPGTMDSSQAFGNTFSPWVSSRLMTFRRFTSTSQPSVQNCPTSGGTPSLRRTQTMDGPATSEQSCPASGDLPTTRRQLPSRLPGSVATLFYLRMPKECSKPLQSRIPVIYMADSLLRWRENKLRQLSRSLRTGLNSSRRIH